MAPQPIEQEPTTYGREQRNPTDDEEATCLQTTGGDGRCNANASGVTQDIDTASRRYLSPVQLLALNAAVGGFLFGYDTGVISGALLQIKMPVRGLGPLTSVEQEIIVSSTVAGAVVGSLMSADLQRRLWFGRRHMMLMGSALFAVGSLIMALAQGVPSLTVGRTMVGISVGIVSHVSPLYISECAPTHLRGQLTALNNVLIVCGQVVSSMICCGIAKSNIEQGWRWMLGIAGLPAFVMLYGFLSLPESPMYILLRGRVSAAAVAEASQVLGWLRNSPPDDVSVSTELSAAVADARQPSAGWQEVLATRPVRRALALGVFLQLLQQMCGVNTIMYYSASILEMASMSAGASASSCRSGGGDGDWEICLTPLIAMAQLVGTILGMLAVERIGRRPLTLVSLTGVTLSLAALGYTFYPKSKIPFANAPVWAMVFYLITFGVGMSPMPWVVNAEIYPLFARSTCIGIATTTNWVSNFIVSATFIDLSKALSTDDKCPEAHPDGAFWLYASIALAGLIIIFFAMPETKGLSFEEIGKLFGHSSSRDR